MEFDFNPDPAIARAARRTSTPRRSSASTSYRGLDNAAYYALTDQDSQTYWNNTGVGNQTRPNHRPFRRLIIDSLRYWVEEMHVDGFRFDLAPVLGEKDLDYYAWDDPKNTVLQDIVDDPVLQKYNTRLIAEPWAAGGYDLGQSYNGPNGQHQPLRQRLRHAHRPVPRRHRQGRHWPGASGTAATATGGAPS